MPDNDDASAPGGPVRAPAPSTVPTLIDEIVRGALDPSYADAVRRRGAHPRSGRSRALTLLVLIVAGLLVAAAAHRQAVRGPEQSRARAALVTDVGTETADNEALAERVAELDAENSTLRAQALASSTEGAELTGQIDALAPVVGQAPVRGQGVTVRFTDASATPAAGAGAAGDRFPIDTPPAGRVLDHDLAEVVNVLWAAGAEAVAAGGVRLTGLTAIRSAGVAILVGFRPVTSPYVVEAVGDPQRLTEALLSSAVAARLQAIETRLGGEFGISTTPELTLPPAPVTTPRRAEGMIDEMSGS